MVKDLLKPVKIPTVGATAKAGVIERLKAFTTSMNSARIEMLSSIFNIFYIPTHRDIATISRQ